MMRLPDAKHSLLVTTNLYDGQADTPQRGSTSIEAKELVVRS